MEIDDTYVADLEQSIKQKRFEADTLEEHLEALVKSDPRRCMVCNKVSDPIYYLNNGKRTCGPHFHENHTSYS